MNRRTAVLGALAVYCAAAARPLLSSPPPYRVIVNPGNPLASLERRFLADAFFKKAIAWPGGEKTMRENVTANQLLTIHTGE